MNSFPHVLLIKSSAQQILFLPSQIKVNYRFPFPILRCFSAISPSVTQRSVSQENIFKKNKHPSPFLQENIGTNIFTLIEYIISSLR